MSSITRGKLVNLASGGTSMKVVLGAVLVIRIAPKLRVNFFPLCLLRWVIFNLDLQKSRLDRIREVTQGVVGSKVDSRAIHLVYIKDATFNMCIMGRRRCHCG
jgi:hypothetical protein